MRQFVVCVRSSQQRRVTRCHVAACRGLLQVLPLEWWRQRLYPRSIAPRNDRSRQRRSTAETVRCGLHARLHTLNDAILCTSCMIPCACHGHKCCHRCTACTCCGACCDNTSLAHAECCCTCDMSASVCRGCICLCRCNPCISL
jgi:hypothetical protein